MKAAFSLLIFACLGLIARGQTVSVTSFGALGDAVTNVFFNTASNSAVVVSTTNIFTTARVGEVVEIFGAGQWNNAPGNFQDVCAKVVSVANGTNLTLDRICYRTTFNSRGTIGTNNAPAFQAAANGVASNAVITIPAGVYLMVGAEDLNSNFVSASAFETHPSVVLNMGGITFLGADRNKTVLLGCGAFKNTGGFVYRGYMFACQGPVTNNGPLVFDTLTMDGGVPVGFTGQTGFPASTNTGDGWDVTHDAVNDVGTAPLHLTKIFRNLNIRNWRGEQLKSVTSGWDGFISVSNCTISDGNASGFNFNFTHVIDSCVLSNLFECMEFYQGYSSNSSAFQNCVVTNVLDLMAFNGAQNNHPNQPYIVRNNTFWSWSGNGIETDPVQNLTISNNLFLNGGFVIAIGITGYLGTGINSNIVVAANIFSNSWTPLEIEGSGANMLDGLMVLNNVEKTTGSGVFAETESGGYGTNMAFIGNHALGSISSVGMTGQYFKDDDSNNFPTKQLTGAHGSNETGYEFGQRDTIVSAQSDSVFYADTLHPLQIPAGAKLDITNSTALTLPVFMNTAMTGSPVSLATGASTILFWNQYNGQWQTTAVITPMAMTMSGVNLLGVGVQ